jgi:hypothetical protein
MDLTLEPSGYTVCTRTGTEFQCCGDQVGTKTRKFEAIYPENQISAIIMFFDV